MNKLNILDKQLKNVAKSARRNAPTILTVLGITGFVSTVVMAVKATPEAMKRLDEVEENLPEDISKPREVFEKVKAVAPVYAPATILGVTSIACVLKANDIQNDRLAAVTTAYEFSSEALKEYQNKVIETFGEKKDIQIRDEIAKDHVEKNKLEEDDVIQASTGTTLFMDSISGRYFRSTKDEIYNKLMSFQRYLFTEDYVSLNEWYYEIGLDAIPIGDRTGWNSTNSIDIHWSVQMASNGEPVTVLEYSTPPTYDYLFANRY